MSLLDVNVKSLTSKLRIASSGRKVQVQGEFGFFFWRVFCLRGSVLCLQVFLCDGMQKRQKNEGEGSARSGRAAKDAYQYSECTLSKSASLLWEPLARRSSRMLTTLLCLYPQINTVAMVFPPRFLHGFQDLGFIFGVGGK